MTEYRAIAWDESNNFSDTVYLYAMTLKGAISKAKKDLARGWIIDGRYKAVVVEIMDDDLRVLETVRKEVEE